MENMLIDQADGLALLHLEAYGPVIQKLTRTMATSLPLYRKMQALQKADRPADGLARFIKTLHKTLLALQPGDAVIVPAGWRRQAGNVVERVDVPLVVECEAAPQADNYSDQPDSSGKPAGDQAAGTVPVVAEQPENSAATSKPTASDAADSRCTFVYRITVCNAGKGLNYHPRVAALAPSKIKYVTAATISRVPQADATDTSFWLSLLVKYASVCQSNSAESFYETLPLLKNEPLESR